MNIGLIYYSNTGNTRTVAEKLEKKLTEKGHNVTREEITITGATPAQPGKFELTNIPNPDGYDAIIFGAPVQAFSLNPVMKAYMEQLPPLDGKRVAIFVTKQLPLLMVGGTGSISIMKNASESKGAKVAASEIVVWAEKKREQSIKECVESIARIF